MSVDGALIALPVSSAQKVVWMKLLQCREESVNIAAFSQNQGSQTS
jgi:hypothetical protein